MGIKSVCAAAALAAGVGPAANAATVHHVKITLADSYRCAVEPCSAEVPLATDFYGLPLGQALFGWLSIGDLDSEGYQEITFSHDGTIHSFGRFDTWYSNSFYLSIEVTRIATQYFGAGFYVSWGGTTGDLRYFNDDVPWSRDLRSPIELVPAPLPATAALLPLGIGALAMLRRRRKA